MKLEVQESMAAARSTLTGRHCLGEPAVCHRSISQDPEALKPDLQADGKEQTGWLPISLPSSGGMPFGKSRLQPRGGEKSDLR